MPVNPLRNLIVGVLLIWPSAAAARVAYGGLASMRQIAAGLGVRCEFCYVRLSTERMDAARPMFEKALELAPESHLANGYLYQLRQTRKRPQP